MNRERIYLGLCWLPPALYGLALFAVRQYDGWGRWAAAPLLLPPLGVSLAWLIGGVALLWNSESGAPERSLLGGAALLGGSPLLILIFRAMLS